MSLFWYGFISGGIVGVVTGFCYCAMLSIKREEKFWATRIGNK